MRWGSAPHLSLKFYIRWHFVCWAKVALVLGLAVMRRDMMVWKRCNAAIVNMLLPCHREGLCSLETEPSSGRPLGKSMKLGGAPIPSVSLFPKFSDRVK